MSTENDFVNHVLDLLETFGNVTARKMFGGYGIFRDGIMFGLVSEDTLYLKTDQQNRPDFEARDLPPFHYSREDRKVALSYYRVPAEAVEDAGTLSRWAEEAYAAAVRSAGGEF